VLNTSTRARLALFAGLATLATLIAVAAAGALGNSTPKIATHLTTAERVSLARVSATGSPIQLPSTDVRTTRLRAAGFSNVTKIGTAGNASFFRVVSSSGRDCYGSGRTGAAWPFAAIICSTAAPYFPSAANPILDQSLVGADSPSEGLHFMSLQGVAADGVAAIQGLDPDGNTVVTTPVAANVYYEPAAKMPSNVVAIEAVDASGNVLTTLPRHS